MEIKADKIIVIAVIAFLAYLLLRGHNVGSEHSLSLNLFGLGTAQLDAGFSYCNLKCQPMETSNCAIPLASDYLVCSYCHKPAITCYAARMVCDNARAQRFAQTPAAVCSFNRASALPYSVGAPMVDPGTIPLCKGNTTPVSACVVSTQQGGLV